MVCYFLDLMKLAWSHIYMHALHTLTSTNHFPTEGHQL